MVMSLQEVHCHPVKFRGSVLAEHFVTFDEAKAVMHVEGDDRENDVSPPDKVIEDLLPVEAVAKDN